MTTPNNQPTPPEGYRLSYEEPFTLFSGVKWLALNGWFDITEFRIGCEAARYTYYAIPITVPATGDTKDAGQTPADALDSVIDDCVEAYEYLGEDESGRDCVYQPTEQEQILIKDAIRTIISDSDFEKAYERVMRDEGDTTNEKGGEPCAETPAPDRPVDPAQTNSAKSTELQSVSASNAPAQVQPLSAGQVRAYELPFSVKGDNPPAIVDATGEAVLSMMWPVHEQTPQGEQLAVSYTKNWAQTICDLVNEANAKPVEQRQNKAFLEAAITEQIAHAEHWKEHYTADPNGAEDKAYWNGRHTAFQEAMNLIQSAPVEQRQELLPCPFCKCQSAASIERNDEYEEEDFPEHKLYYHVICDASCGGCGSSGGFRKTPEAAIKLWNTRK